MYQGEPIPTVGANALVENAMSNGHAGAIVVSRIAAASAASACWPGITWASVSTVDLTEECLKRSLTTFTSIPAMSNRDAWVCVALRRPEMVWCPPPTIGGSIA